MPEIALPGNIEIITRFEHAFRAAEQATIDELADLGLADHNPAPGHEPTLAGFKQKVAGFKAVFPDLVEDLQDIIASGDTVATWWAVTGSLQQDFMGTWTPPGPRAPPDPAAHNPRQPPHPAQATGLPPATRRGLGPGWATHRDGCQAASR